MSFDPDAELQSAMDSANAAADQDKLQAIYDGDKVGATQGEHLPVKEWMSNLPKNITVGLMDAASNTVDSAKVFGEAAWRDLQRPSYAIRAANVSQGRPADMYDGTWEDVREKFLAQPTVTETYGPIRAAYQDLRNHLAAGSDTSDGLTQGLAQFAIPFLGWSKMLGVQKAISTVGRIARGVGAESLTVSTAWEPHAGRMADFVAQGKTVQGKFGDALNTLAPDGSALNAYINYMTDRSDESEAEGRFKNVIDSLTVSAATAALFKAGAKALKVGLNTPPRGATPVSGAP